MKKLRCTRSKYLFIYISRNLSILFLSQILINKHLQWLTYVSDLSLSHLLHILEDWLLTNSLGYLFHVLIISILDFICVSQHFTTIIFKFFLIWLHYTFFILFLYTYLTFWSGPQILQTYPSCLKCNLVLKLYLFNKFSIKF